MHSFHCINVVYADKMTVSPKLFLLLNLPGKSTQLLQTSLCFQANQMDFPANV